MSTTVEVFEKTEGSNFRMRVTPALSGIDLTDVTAARVTLRRDDDSEFAWTGLALENQTETTLDLVRVTETDDFPEPELIRAFGFLTVAGADKRLKPFHIHVLPFAAP